MPVCLNHPDTNAVAFCAACRKPLCSNCVVEIEAHKFCSVECHQKFSAALKRSNTVLKEMQSTRQKKRKKQCWYFLIFLILA